MEVTEIPLDGGNTSEGVVRVGNTVRKKMTAHSHTVHRLLTHLERRGFKSCPKYLGIDGKGREIISFMNGDTGIPSHIWDSDDCLIDTARLLRRYHDATVNFQTEPNDSWAFAYPDKSRHEVIGHTDFAPYNLVYNDSRPTSIIDFDLAGPAPRSRDLAYSAYWNVPLSFNDKSMKRFALADLKNDCKRLRMFCDAYGTRATGELLEMVSEVLAHMGNEKVAIRMIGESAATRLRDGGHFAHWLREHTAFNAQKNALRSLFDAS